MMYNILEVFELAEQIERNGSAFYRAAADRHRGDEAARNLLRGLAEMEDQHEIIFGRLKNQVALKVGSHDYSPDEESLAYLRVAASSHIFAAKDRDPEALARTALDLTAVLRAALQVEKDTVALFAGLRDAMPAEWGREHVTAILDEEKRHVVMLTTALEALGAH